MLVVLATTYLSLIIGELVPKRVALQNAEAIAASVAGPMTVLAAAGRPVVWFLRLSTETALRLIGRRDVEGSVVTEEEVKALIAEGAEAGVFQHAERRMLESVLRFADRPVRTIMVPRPEMVWLRADDPIEVALDAIRSSGHSRFPLCASDLDDILGVVLVRDIIELSAAAAATCARWCATRSMSARASRP